MVQNSASVIAFSMPGGEKCVQARSRPIDLVHLTRQTMGDRALEQDVLALFIQQALSVRDKISSATAAERLRLAHTLKGSARSVGAFAIAECAAAIEEDPDGRQLPKKLAVLIDQARDFVAAINR
jgi:HPt (histidine-containing phosphotransfer) domain-containing protein